MDQFLSGFGTMFDGSAGVKQETGPSSNNDTATTRQEAALPNKPVKVSDKTLGLNYSGCRPGRVIFCCYCSEQRQFSTL